MIDEIRCLPPLPTSIIKIQELCNEREVNVSKLIDVIGKDPMLSANILKAVNSPLYGMSKEITSIRQALTLFGVSMIRGFAVSSSIKKTILIDLSPYGMTIENMGEVSAMQLALVREWYNRVDKSLLNSLMEGAFLMELGKLMVANKLTSLSKGGSFASEVHEGKEIQELEVQYVGYTSYALAAMMFEHWNFDDHLVQMLRCIDDPEGEKEAKLSLLGKILHVVKEAVSVRESFGEQSLHNAHLAIERFHLDKKSFDEAVCAVQTNMQEKQ